MADDFREITTDRQDKLGRVTNFYIESIRREHQTEQVNDEHRELQPSVFHPSYFGKCRRQMLIAKLGLTQPGDEASGIFTTGNAVHEMARKYTEMYRVDHEVPVRGSIEDPRDINGYTYTIRGHADLIDWQDEIVYDFKSRNGYYRFDQDNPKTSYAVQLSIYRDILQEQHGGDWEARLLMINKKNALDVREVQNVTDKINSETIKKTMRRAEDVRDATEALVYREDQGEPLELNHERLSSQGLPFEKCGCFICGQEHKDNYEPSLWAYIKENERP